MSSSPSSDNLVFEYEGSLGFTILQNIFIERYMPSANGSYVKVYLAGLARCFGKKDAQWASHRTIAEACGLGVSISTVKRAWKHWEAAGLVQVFPRFLRDVHNPQDYSFERSTVYCIPTSSVVRFTNLQELAQQVAIRQALAAAQAEVAAAVDGGVGSPVNRGSGHGRTEGRVMGEPLIRTREAVQLEAVQGRDDQPPVALPVVTVDTVVSGPATLPDGEVQECLEMSILGDTYTRVTGKEPSQAEKAHLWRLFTTYGLADADDALKEAATKRKGKNLLRYVEGILGNWAREGKRVSLVGTSLAPQEGASPASHSARSSRLRGAAPRAENPSYYAKFARLEEEMLDAEPVEEASLLSPH